ncbi:MAG: lycopene cyclase domain-containing protein [Candidatus Saccharimonadota bacterium]|jgi:lycopene cyclase domain-containing protein
MEWFYLLGLSIGIAGMATIDWRYKLAFWRDRRRTSLTLAAAIGLFIVWDFLGIWLGIFFHGGSPYSLPLRLAPEFPLEELFFLFLLSYCTLVMYNGVTSWLSRTSS